MKLKFLTVPVLVIISFLTQGCSEKHRLFVGGFNKPGENGMSVYDFDKSSGKLTSLAQVDAGPAPSYFCYSAGKQLMYVINEVMEFKGEFGGGLSTFRVDNTGTVFEKLNEMLIPYAGPCYISMSPDSGYVFIANYPNGSVAVVKLDDKGIPQSITDTILYNPGEPDRSHAHMIMNNPSGGRIYVSDLGLDRIMIYDFDELSGKLNLIEDGIEPLPAGFGPRHFVFNMEGTKLYVINELGSKVTVYDVNGEGQLRIIQTVPTTAPGYIENNYCADVHLSSDGRFLYGSNRGENTIVVFRVENDGTLELAGRTKCGGNWPRNFTLDPSGSFILVGNQKSDSISVFRIDKKTGLPLLPPQQYPSEAPACLKFY
ncbi:MAG: lactonase family protein [Bacteroidales bacterium]|jgi:6-phosphogluconolactonase|nr:lactonase family protein [Bacteroidales bacterium]